MWLMLAQATQPAVPSDGSWVGQWIADLFNTAWGWLQSFVYWILTYVFNCGATLIDWFLSVLPAGLTQGIADIAAAIQVANLYLPISEFFTCVAAYFVFVAFFVLVKFVLKLIPTIG